MDGEIRGALTMQLQLCVRAQVLLCDVDHPNTRHGSATATGGHNLVH